MIDLTNKNIDEINNLLQKYASALDLIHPREKAQFALVIQIAFDYIMAKYNNLNKDWKAWCVVVLKKLHQSIQSEEDVRKIIDEFMVFAGTKYQAYVDDLAISASEFDRDFGFVSMFIHEKNR